MSTKSIRDVLNLADGLEDGMELDILNFEAGKDKVGKFVTITCVDGKKYRTYGQYVIESLVKARDEMKFHFGKDSLSCSVKEKMSEGNNKYLTLA